jgi:hypothetical protein
MGMTIGGLYSLGLIPCGPSPTRSDFSAFAFCSEHCRQAFEANSSHELTA